MTDRPRPAATPEVFSGRVVAMFLIQVAQAAIGLFNGFLLARLIGPTGKGEYYLLVFLPTTIMVLIQLGLPQAITYYSARSQTRGLMAKAVVLTMALSVPAMVVTAGLIPSMQATFLDGLETNAILLGLCVLPLLVSSTLTTGVVVGRQDVKWLAAVRISQALVATVLIVVLVGVLGLGVAGALAAFLVTSLAEAAASFIAAQRVGARVPRPETVSYRALFAYGLPLYPGSLTYFFGYRIDVYLLAWLLADAAAPLGYYSMAVSMAELVFFVPNAVSSLFFTQVAGSAREDVDREVNRVSRVTLLVTVTAALALVPVAAVLIHVVLPAFVPALPALYILLPGVVMISNTKVLGGYLNGLGLTGVTSVIHVTAFVINVAVNLLLIPTFGILGAAAASLVSYSVSSVMFSLAVRHHAKVPLHSLWIPTRGDVRFTALMMATLLNRLITHLRRTAGRRPARPQ
jgi:O-antigen/teichoic acid export membrane protein